MHGNGINMRHLGRVRSHVTDRGLKVLLLSEMVARVAKQILRYTSGSNSVCFSHISMLLFRERLRKHRNELDDSDEQIVLNLLNEIIGNYYVPEKPVPQTRTVLYVLDSHTVILALPNHSSFYNMHRKPPDPAQMESEYDVDDQFVEEQESEKEMRKRLTHRDTENYVEVLEKGIPPFWSQKWKIEVLDNKFKTGLTEEEKEW